MIKQYINFENYKNAIVTIAIGDNFLNGWKTYSKKSWEIYCNKYKLNLFVITDDLIAKNHKKWKKPTWQKMLIADAFKNSNFKIDNICYLDTDILISPKAKNVFENYDEKKYGLVSKVKELPFNLLQIKKKIAFLRNRFYDKEYPLDSSLFMNHEENYKYSNLTVQDNEACAGLILFNVHNHHKEMKEWFLKYDINTVSITGGDQVHLNWEVQNTKNVNWLTYDFQALWLYEIVSKYPFLYDEKICTDELIVYSIQACLLSVNFLHFAGSWHECDMWKNKNIITNSFLELINDYQIYDNYIPIGKPKGRITPKKSLNFLNK